MKNFLYTPDAQKFWAQAGFRPVDPGVAAEFADDFPTPQKLWTITDLGGWAAVDPALFDKNTGKHRQDLPAGDRMTSALASRPAPGSPGGFFIARNGRTSLRVGVATSG